MTAEMLWTAIAVLYLLGALCMVSYLCMAAKFGLLKTPRYKASILLLASVWFIFIIYVSNSIIREYRELKL